jgi:hypothetical protein
MTLEQIKKEAEGLSFDEQGDLAAFIDRLRNQEAKDRSKIVEDMLRIKEEYLANGGRTFSREEIAEELRERRGGLA